MSTQKSEQLVVASTEVPSETLKQNTMPEAPVVAVETIASAEEASVVPDETLVPENKDTEVFERYIEPIGTKVEVAPVDVASAGDVVKKNKKKNKNKNKNKN